MKRRLVWFFALLLLIGLLAGCAAAPTAQNATAAYDMDIAYPMTESVEAPAAAPEAESGGWEGDTQAARESGGTGGYKIIKTANLSLETRNFDVDLAYIREKADTMGGYVSSSYVSGRKPENYGDAGRYASLSIRIPQARMDAFLADARGVATVVSESTGGEDITSSYFDTESRLAVYTAQRERILKLLESATEMEDIIALEQEHARLTYEIESLTTQVKRWDDLVDFATVHIDLNEIAPVSATVSDESFGARVGEGMRRTLSGMSVFFENLAVFLIVASPVLLLIAAAVIVVVVLCRRRKKRGGGKPKKQKGAPKDFYEAAPQPAPEKTEE